MTAKIIQFIPRPNPKREGAEFPSIKFTSLALEAAEIMREVVPYEGKGIDGMNLEPA